MKQFYAGELTSVLLNSIVELNEIISNVLNATESYDGLAELNTEPLSEAIYKANSALYNLINESIGSNLALLSNIKHDNVAI